PTATAAGFRSLLEAWPHGRARSAGVEIVLQTRLRPASAWDKSECHKLDRILRAPRSHAKTRAAKGSGHPTRSARCAELLETLDCRQTRQVANAHSKSAGPPNPQLRARGLMKQPVPGAIGSLPASAAPERQRLRRNLPLPVPSSNLQEGSRVADRPWSRQSSRTVCVVAPKMLVGVDAHGSKSYLL